MENNMNEKEFEILGQAIAALEIAAKVKVAIVGTYDWEIQPLRRADATLMIKTAEKELRFIAEIKATITPNVLMLVGDYKPYRQIGTNRTKWLLVTKLIPPQFAKILREREIPFIDTAGNAYIDEPPIHIDIQGRRPEGMEWPKLAEKGILRQAGLRVVYALICKNELVNATYREIAEAAGTALGTVDRVFKDLRKRRFIIETGNRGRRLTDRRELIGWWVKEYAEKLRPKLLLGKFETDDYEKFRLTDITKFNAKWGGEMAAAEMTNYLRPEIYTIYARKPINDLILQIKLRARPLGKIEIRERFWKFEDERRSKELAHPILVYADLLATGDPRNIETAKIIYDAIITMEN
jgi:hypothetical protein